MPHITSYLKHDHKEAMSEMRELDLITEISQVAAQGRSNKRKEDAGSSSEIVQSVTPSPSRRRSLATSHIPFARNEKFFGREDILTDVHDALKPISSTEGTRECGSVALVGLGGVGKTQVVLEYCYRHIEDYEMILWFQADTVERFTTSVEHAARHLGLLAEGPSKQKDFSWSTLLRKAGQSVLCAPQNHASNQTRKKLLAVCIRQHR
jgi:hypothetical protein